MMWRVMAAAALMVHAVAGGFRTGSPTIPDAPVPAPAAGASVSGTYAIVLCDSTCAIADSARAIASGLLVLSDRPIDLRALPAPRRTTMQRAFAYVARAARPNGCFVLRQRSATDSIGLRAMPVGFTSWYHTTRDSVAFGLYQSPDAGYTVRLQLERAARDGAGTGYFWTASAPHARQIVRRVVVRRVGKADATPCLAAARRTT